MAEFEERFYSPCVDSAVTESRFSTRHCHCIAGLLQRLDTTAKTNKELVAACKHLIYSVLLIGHTRKYTGSSEAFFTLLLHSGLLNQATKDAKWAHPLHLKKQVN